ncbi:hypothetical protein V7968_32835 [Nocardia vulneris]|uniref:hypothetical protein n=1 Tax=Nocardia vulneris TaxID=1141657 RepID=UPI0030D1672D
MEVSTSPQDGAAARRLDGLPLREIIEKFRSLEAPQISELDGEYVRTMVHADSRLVEFVARLGVSVPIHHWHAKAFRPETATQGIGYNAMTVLGRPTRLYPMRTLVAPSRYDARPAFQLVYGAFRSPLGALRAVDELRTLSPGVYLGLGHLGLTARQRKVPIAFVLEGPIAQYRGDIGTPVPGFEIGIRELPALGTR